MITMKLIKSLIFQIILVFNLLEQSTVMAEFEPVHCIKSNPNINVERIKGSRVLLGEGPHWDMDSQSLYYVDLTGHQLCRYSEIENKVYKCNVREYSA